jgi:hypothetical protein
VRGHVWAPPLGKQKEIRAFVPFRRQVLAAAGLGSFAVFHPRREPLSEGAQRGPEGDRAGTVPVLPEPLCLLPAAPLASLLQEERNRDGECTGLSVEASGEDRHRPPALPVPCHPRAHCRLNAGPARRRPDPGRGVASPAQIPLFCWQHWGLNSGPHAC